ncbi:unnamed protein product [Cyprideis torosa]|uniref:Ammonium transporter AmtB-like domain-containing protein n=1 Tax=Cyprideis torosa TaxID=163714 RepID=A0A7R8W2P1_9CRUS|nr:unnamed protein product [Cyprideis torosa]CAG0882148.1 unnamed protein product [Cyprideis torosa]
MKAKTTVVFMTFEVIVIMLMGLFVDFEATDEDPTGVIHNFFKRNDYATLQSRIMGAELQCRTALFFILCEIVFIVLFAVYVENPRFADEEADHTAGEDPSHAQPTLPPKRDLYAMFQDTHVMIFVGFGFLMTFLRHYGYSAVGINFLLGAFFVQWAILCQGGFHSYFMGHPSIHMTLNTILNADIAVASVLISFGALLGRTTPMQLFFMGLVEIVLFSINEFVVYNVLKAFDAGGSIVVHTFGALFGMFCSLAMINRKASKEEDAHMNRTSNYFSNLFSMIGTIFLWVFWPSFNAALTEEEDQVTAVTNTYLSLAASVVATFAISYFVVHGGKIEMEHVQNATLAGGVAIGAVCDKIEHPFGALIIGFLAGTISTLGYRFLTPLLEKKLQMYDTCGVNNLHGMPGIFSGIASCFILMAEFHNSELDSEELSFHYHANGTQLLHKKSELHVDAWEEVSRTNRDQALAQFEALAMTIGIAIVGGLITGFILRLTFFGQVHKSHWYEDHHNFELPDLDEDGIRRHGSNLGAGAVDRIFKIKETQKQTAKELHDALEKGL